VSLEWSYGGIMPASREQKIKLRVLYDLLVQHTDEDNPMSAAQITSMLHAKYIMPVI